MIRGLLQPTHIFFILLIVLLIFGPGKLPELGKSLGKGIREFKDAISGGTAGDSEKKEEDTRGVLGPTGCRRALPGFTTQRVKVRFKSLHLVTVLLASSLIKN